MSGSHRPLLQPLGRILLLVLLTGIAQAQTPRDPEVLRERLEQLRERMGRVQEELSAETRRRDALAAELGEAERRQARIAGTLRELEAQLQATNARLAELEVERAELTDELAAQRGALAASVRSAFLMGREQRLKLMLNQRDVAAAGRAMGYYRYLHRARVARIESVRESLARLRAVESDIAARRDELDALRARQGAELARERAAQAERREVLAAIRDRIASRGETLAALERDERALEDLLRSIEAALADIPARLEEPFDTLKGRLDWPLGRITAIRPEDNGLMLSAESGTPVHAVAPGRVAYADWMRGYGLLVILDHGDGYMSLYAHNHSLFKGVGDWVGAGEPIGEVGASGGRDSAGLYFELRQGGDPIPARGWLAERGG